MPHDQDISNDANRYFLYAIGVDIDLDAQLDASRTLLERHRAADVELTERIKRLEERAHGTTGRASELAVDEWLDSIQRSIYQDAAHSLAAVGMLAPLLEIILVHSFAALRTHFALCVSGPRAWPSRRRNVGIATGRSTNMASGRRISLGAPCN